MFPLIPFYRWPPNPILHSDCAPVWYIHNIWYWSLVNPFVHHYTGWWFPLSKQPPPSLSFLFTTGMAYRECIWLNIIGESALQLINLNRELVLSKLFPVSKMPVLNNTGVTYTFWPRFCVNSEEELHSPPWSFVHVYEMVLFRLLCMVFLFSWQLGLSLFPTNSFSIRKTSSITLCRSTESVYSSASSSTSKLDLFWQIA